MSFLGLFTFTAPYLPWVILGFGKPIPSLRVFVRVRVRSCVRWCVCVSCVFVRHVPSLLCG
jgi:hypothetical protein